MVAGKADRLADTSDSSQRWQSLHHVPWEMADIMANCYQRVTELEQAGRVDPVEQETYLCAVR